MQQVTRRRALQAVGAATAAGLAGCADSDATDDLCGSEAAPTDNTIETAPAGGAPVPPDRAGWPQVGYDAARTGYASVVAPTDDVGVGWSTTVDLGYGTTSLVAAGETLVTVAGDDDGSVVALDRGDGTIRWLVEDLSEPSEPAIAEGLVVVPTRTGLHAFALDDGTEQWTLPGDDADAAPEFYGPVAYADGAFLVDKKAAAVAVAPDGTERWRAPDADVGAVADGTAYLVGDGFRAVDLATGDQRWTREDRPTGRMAVHDGTVYAGGLRDFQALDAESGDAEWSFEGEWEDFGPPAVTEDAVFVGTSPTEGNDGGNLYAFERDSGEPRWCQFYGYGLSRPAVADDAVLVGTEGVLEARDPDDGSSIWRFSPAGDTYAEFGAPAVAGGVCYAATDRRVYAFAER